MTAFQNALHSLWQAINCYGSLALSSVHVTVSWFVRRCDLMVCNTAVPTASFTAPDWKVCDTSRNPSLSFALRQDAIWLSHLARAPSKASYGAQLMSLSKVPQETREPLYPTCGPHCLPPNYLRSVLISTNHTATCLVLLGTTISSAHVWCRLLYTVLCS